MLLTKIFIFIIGSTFASFANLVVLRTIRGESIVFPQSHCDSCGHRLRARDLVPILSYIFLRGRCRYCKSKIPLESFMVELILGLVFAIIFDYSNILGSILLFFGIMLALIIALIDLKTYDIYMIQVGILSLVGIIYRYLFIGFDIKFVYIVLGFALCYFLIYFLSKAGIGDGDVYFYLALFLFIENKFIIWFVLVSIWIGAIYGISIFLKYKSLKIEIPFCIFIFMAFLIIVLFRGYPI